MFGWWFAYFFSSVANAWQTSSWATFRGCSFGCSIFLSKKILKRKPHVPEQSLYLRQTEVLFLINRGSVSSQQNLCFSIHSPNLIFYTRAVSHRTTLFPSYSPQYSPNTTIPFKTPPFQPKKICTNSHSCTTFAAASNNVCTMGITRNQQQVNKNTPQWNNCQTTSCTKATSWFPKHC